MALLDIRLFGDPVLRERATEVTAFDARLERLAGDMLATMRAAGGAGLAANQVGVLKRLFVWEIATERSDTPEEIGHGAVVNPEVVEVSEESHEGEEGCLSFPGLFYPTNRPLAAVVRSVDIHGDPHTTEAEGMLARIFLHEIDHLNGILFIDHLARHDRKDAMRRIRAGELEENARRGVATAPGKPVA